MAVAVLAPAEQLDPSREIVSQLLQPPLIQLPGIDELEKLLFSPPSVKLPIHARVLCKIQDSTVAQHFQGLDLSSCISFAVDQPEMPAGPIQGLDKPSIAMSVHLNFLMTVLHLDALSGKNFLVAEHAPVGSARPVGTLYGTDGQRAVSVWDEWNGSLGGDSIKGVIHFLARRPVPWDSCMYGDAKYMLCFAAAGEQFQFAAIDYSQPEPVPVPIGQVLNMGRPVDRAKLVVAAVNYYRFLVAFDRALPQRCPVADQGAYSCSCSL